MLFNRRGFGGGCCGGFPPMMPCCGGFGGDCCGPRDCCPRDCCPKDNCCNDPIIEPTIEKCVKRDFCHEVRHICPIHTRVINNHIVRHTYSPQFTQSEENVVTQLDQGSCCNFV